jgi:anion-transporting  ArsA/GET3 family ATPase
MEIDTSNSIISNLKRINLISGKGGVGRTTLAATLARAAAASGKKTLLLEIEDDSGWDSALARSFGRKHFQIEPEKLEKNLYGLCLTATTGQEMFLNSFLKLNSLTQMIMGNQGVKWFLEGAPAFKEMGYFYHLLIQMRADFDTIILDLPATGHFIGLAKLPELLLKMIPFGPIADRLKEGQRFLYDEDHSATWIVTLPQTLPVSEAIELKTVLSNENLPIGGFILNRAPFNPFTEEEERVLEGLSQKSTTKKLMVDLERIRRFREASKRLQEEIVKDEGVQSLWVAPEAYNPLEELHFGHRLQKVKC